MNKRNIIAHAHIFKNAGTTIDWILRKNFGAHFNENREDQRMLKEPTYLKSLLELNPMLKAVSSHSMPLPLSPIDDLTLHTIVMLRDPLLRVRSAYEFEKKQQANTLGAINAKDKSFKDYVAWRMLPEVPPTIKNMHVRYLTRNSMPIKVVLSEGHLESAIEFVNENQLVGLVEKFDESALIFANHLKQYEIDVDFSYKRQNVGSSTHNKKELEIRQLQSDLGDELFEKLLLNNALDIKLYKYFEKLFLERIIGIPSFDKKLNELREISTQV